jgi:hypothetical protein
VLVDLPLAAPVAAPVESLPTAGREPAGPRVPTPAAAPAPGSAQVAPPSPDEEAMRSALAAKPDIALRPGMLLAEPQPTPTPEMEARLGANVDAAAGQPAAQADEWASFSRPDGPDRAAPPLASAPVPVPAPEPAPQPVPAVSEAAAQAPATPAANAPAVTSPETPAADAADDAEDLYLLRAERSLKKGSCQRFLAGLEEIAGDTPASERTERARIVRARCFDKLGKPVQARAEYARYLHEMPRGDFASEAERRLNRSDTRLSDN